MPIKKAEAGHPVKTSPYVVACVALLLVVTIGGIRLTCHDRGEILGFFRLGTFLPPSPYLGSVPAHVVSKGELGYDGQFFLALALDPCLSQPGSIASLDNPRYRYRRILYPLFAFMLSLGRKAWIPYLLVLVNAACMVGIVFPSALWFRDEGDSSWWALFVLGITGGWTVFFLSTADLLAGFLLILSLTVYLRGFSWVAAVAMAAAGMTHETTLLVLSVFWLDALFRKDWKSLFLFTLSPVPAVLWNLHIFHTLPPARSTTGIFENFTYPLGGVIAKIHALVAAPLHAKTLYEGLSFFIVTLMVVILGIAPRASRKARVLQGCGMVYLILYCLVSFHVFSYYLGYNRVFMNAGFLFVLMLTVPAWRRVKVGVLALSSLSAFLFVVAYTLGRI
jgi:hypothetical protein